MRLLKVYDGDYPWDVRVEKIVEALLAAGHEVRLVCRNRSGCPRREILAPGFEVARLPALPDPLSFPFFGNPVWIAAVARELRRFRPDVLLMRDLPLAPLAVVVGRLCGVPVVADLAEPYPDSMRSLWQFQKITWVDRVARNPWLADLVELYVVRRIAHALVVCPEAGRRLERQGLPAGIWTEVGNTSRLEHFVPRGESVPELGELGGRFVLLFSGLLAGDRGLDTALEALAQLQASEPGHYLLVVVGEGPVRPALERQVARLGLRDHVHFSGWIDHERLPDVITQADLGLLPFHACPHINATLANKLFEYMSLGLPVVASDVPPMVRVLEESGGGQLFRSGDAEDLACVIATLANAPDLRKQCGERGREATRRTYNWDADSARLIEIIERVGAGASAHG